MSFTTVSRMKTKGLFFFVIDKPLLTMTGDGLNALEQLSLLRLYYFRSARGIHRRMRTSEIDNA